MCNTFQKGWQLYVVPRGRSEGVGLGTPSIVWTGSELSYVAPLRLVTGCTMYVNVCGLASTLTVHGWLWLMVSYIFRIWYFWSSLSEGGLSVPARFQRHTHTQYFLCWQTKWVLRSLWEWLKPMWSDFKAQVLAIKIPPCIQVREVATQSTRVVLQLVYSNVDCRTYGRPLDIFVVQLVGMADCLLLWSVILVILYDHAH